MFKKIIINKKKYRFGDKYAFSKKNYTIVENNFDEIKKKINKIFL
jgi:hypothetical protein